MFDKEGTTKTAHPDNRNHALSSHTRTSRAHTHGHTQHTHGHTHGHTHTHTTTHKHARAHTHTHVCTHNVNGGGGVLRPASSSAMSLSLARWAMSSSFSRRVACTHRGNTESFFVSESELAAEGSSGRYIDREHEYRCFFLCAFRFSSCLARAWVGSLHSYPVGALSTAGKRS